MILIVASTKDKAGVNIANKIIQQHRFKETSELFHGNPIYLRSVHNFTIKLIFINKQITCTQFISEIFNPNLVVFVSRHSSKSGKPTLSVHTPGNLGNAKFGGIPRKVSIAPASVMKDTLIEMEKVTQELIFDYEISYECTHHGPSLDVPAMFVELGSSPKEWKDFKAAEVVAKATMTSITKNSKYPTVLGIGGPHYNKKFTKVALYGKEAFGHIIPKYAIPKINFGIINQCRKKTVENVKKAIVDWKGIKGEYKTKVIEILDELGLEIMRI